MIFKKRQIILLKQMKKILNLVFLLKLKQVNNTSIKLNQKRLRPFRRIKTTLIRLFIMEVVIEMIQDLKLKYDLDLRPSKIFFPEKLKVKLRKNRFKIATHFQIRSN